MKQAGNVRAEDHENRTVMRRKNSIRLKGFDYSEPGSYFVTICTRNRVCILGDILDGVMMLSDMGRIVEMCWRAIPNHFGNTKVDVFQVMPNHVHGIVEIRPLLPHTPSPGKPVEVKCIEGNCRGEVASPSSRKGDETSPLRKTTLGAVVAHFKYQATKRINEKTQTPGREVFQRNYYDHIVRDDTDHFFVQQYIEVNPLLWYLDADNSNTHRISIGDLRQTLNVKHHLDGFVLERIIEHELSYRNWWNEAGATIEG